MPHVLKHHGERFSICAHSVEADDVLMLENGQELGLALEVLSSRLVSVLQRLDKQNSQESVLSILLQMSDQLLLDYQCVCVCIYIAKNKSLYTLPKWMNKKILKWDDVTKQQQESRSA